MITLVLVFDTQLKSALCHMSVERPFQSQILRTSLKEANLCLFFSSQRNSQSVLSVLADTGVLLLSAALIPVVFLNKYDLLTRAADRCKSIWVIAGAGAKPSSRHNDMVRAVSTDLFPGCNFFNPLNPE